MRTGYYLKRGFDISRDEGLLYFLKASLRYISYRIVDESTRFVLRTRLRFLFQRLRYDAPRDPFETIPVDPNELTSANYELSQYGGLGLIKGGEWDADSNNEPIEEYWSVTGIRERFVDGRAWEETTYYRTAEERIADSGEFWRYEDIDEFRRNRCEYVDSLFEDIERNGYRSNSDGEHDVPETLYKQKPHQRLEVLVTIGRNGEILFRDGHHRVAIAQILDVDRIPVNVLARHENWQKIRDRVRDADSVADLGETAKRHLHHPDLSDVVAEES